MVGAHHVEEDCEWPLVIFLNGLHDRRLLGNACVVRDVADALGRGRQWRAWLGGVSVWAVGPADGELAHGLLATFSHFGECRVETKPLHALARLHLHDGVRAALLDAL